MIWVKKMSRKAAYELIRTPKLGNFSHPFSSNLHNLGRRQKGCSSRPRIDFTAVNDVDGAVCLFREMLRMQPQPSLPVYTAFLSDVVKMKLHPVALYMFDEMRQRGTPVDEFIFNIAINCYCIVNRVDFGFAMLGTIFKSGYNPNATTFNTLIKGLFLDHKVVEAATLFKKLFVLRICEPDDVMILTLINGLCKAGQPVPAFELLSALEKTKWKPNVKAYSALVDGFCKVGMVDDAVKLFTQMIDNGISPDVVTYNSMIQGLCGVGRFDDAINLLNEMSERKIFSNLVTFNILVDAYCKHGSVKEAEGVVEDMMQQNVCPDVVTYTALMQGYCLEGNMHKAKQVFNFISHKGLKPCIISYGTLMDGYCKKGKIDEAWNLFLEVPRKGLKHNSHIYNILIHGLFCKGRYADGWKLFQ